MGWKLIGKILFFGGIILTTLTFLWRELLLGGVHVTYIVYAMEFSWGLIILGIIIWTSQLGKEKTPLNNISSPHNK